MFRKTLSFSILITLPLAAACATIMQGTTQELGMDGYEPFELTLSKSTSGWVWGNLVFGGIPGLAVDAISGGLYKLNPAQVQAELQRSDVAGSAEVTEDGVFVFVALEPRVEWERLEGVELERRWW